MSIQSDAVESQCESYFQEMENNPNYLSVESKIDHLLKREKQCGGTGLYESRLSYYYSAAGNFNKAKTVLEKGLSVKNEYHSTLKFSLADLLVQQGDMKGAYAAALALRDEFPEGQPSHMLLAKITLMEKHYEDSIAHAQKANALNPSANVYAGMVIAYHQLDKHKEAVQAMQQLIDLDESFLGKSTPVNEAIYSLGNLSMFEAAAKLAHMRMERDSHWQTDTVFVNAVNLLRQKGALE